MGSIGIWQLVVIAVIVVLLFGTKRLGSIGSDLGASIKGFKKAMSEDDSKDKGEANEKSSADADFTGQSLSEKHSDVKKDDAKSQTKE